MVALDVDGVLSDGGISIDNSGIESKRFYVRDGLGIRLLLDSGIKVGLITARKSKVVEKRAKELSLTFVHQGVKDKWGCLQSEMEQAKLKSTECAFMGDDLIDLAILTKVGLATSPVDAAPEVINHVDWVSQKPGGSGAVRELAEEILKAQNMWDGIINRLINR
ncbi:MAG: phenylphosphate carboxylase subunit delta [Magnetococcales bacterium]|nr:phenylphosphate carboxylase subunit delta [Magnetococcales bacterium]